MLQFPCTKSLPGKKVGQREDNFIFGKFLSNKEYQHYNTKETTHYVCHNERFTMNVSIVLHEGKSLFIKNYLNKESTFTVKQVFGLETFTW